MYQNEIAKITAANADNYTGRAKSFAAWADEQDATAEVARKRLLAAASADSPLQSLLDIGCGNGRDTIAFARSGVACAVGMDPCTSLLDIARRNAPAACSFHQGDIVDLPARWQPPLERKFDAFFALASLFHVPKKALPAALANVAQMSAPRALLLTSFPTGDSDKPMGDGRWCTALSSKEHDSLLRSAGFEPIDRFEVAIYNGHWEVVISRKNN